VFGVKKCAREGINLKSEMSLKKLVFENNDFNQLRMDF